MSLRNKIRYLLTLWIFISASAAVACPFGAGGKYPKCAVEMPSKTDTVIVIETEYVNKVPNPTNLLLGTPPRPAFVVDVQVAHGDSPVYVVLDSGDYDRHGRIFRFSGNTRRISKVVAFASLRDDGKVPVGIIGLETSQVSFAPTTGDDLAYASYCMGAPKICRGWQYFRYSGEWDTLWRGWWKLSKTPEQIAAHDAAAMQRPMPYAHMVASEGSSFSIPPETHGHHLYAEAEPSKSQNEILLNPVDVISPGPVILKPAYANPLQGKGPVPLGDRR